MPMRVRSILIVLAAGLCAATTSQHARVESPDPCGDIVYAHAGGRWVAGQPESWSSFDVEHVMIEEVGERDEGTYAVRITLDLCADAVDPQQAEHPFQLYRVEWGAGGGCSQGIQIGSDERGIHVVGNLGVETPDQRNVFETCPDLDVAGAVGTEEYTTLVDIPDGALLIEGDRIEVTLRPDDLPDFADSFASGVVWGAPRVRTRAEIAMASGSACLPPNGPTGTTCAAVRDGDRVDLPDLVLTDPK